MRTDMRYCECIDKVYQFKKYSFKNEASGYKVTCVRCQKFIKWVNRRGLIRSQRKIERW